jgi:hypothetical protein
MEVSAFRQKAFGLRGIDHKGTKTQRNTKKAKREAAARGSTNREA